jgi:hypothetical protein
MLGQNRHKGQDQRQLAILCLRKIEADRLRILDLDRGNLAISSALGRPALFLQKRETEFDIGCRDRLAVRKPGCGIKPESDEAALLIPFDAFGKQAVEREGLVPIAEHQRLYDIGHKHGRGITPHDQRIDRGEGLGLAEHDAPAFGSLRVDERQMRKVLCQFRFAMHGDAVHRLGMHGCCSQCGDREADAPCRRPEKSNRHSAIMPCLRRIVAIWRALQRIWGWKAAKQTAMARRSHSEAAFGQSWLS